MATAIALIMADDGQISVGEVDPATINPAELQPVQGLDEAVQVIETLAMGDQPAEGAEEAAFNQSVGEPSAEKALLG
jgi:hypothetical protein